MHQFSLKLFQIVTVTEELIKLLFDEIFSMSRDSNQIYVIVWGISHKTLFTLSLEDSLRHRLRRWKRKNFRSGAICQPPSARGNVVCRIASYKYAEMKRVTVNSVSVSYHLEEKRPKRFINGSVWDKANNSWRSLAGESGWNLLWR